MLFNGGNALTRNSTSLLPYARPGVIASDVALHPEHEQAVRNAQAGAQARNTIQAYRTQVHLFEAWCGLHGYSALPPVAPKVVAAYVTERRSGALPARRYVSRSRQSKQVTAKLVSVSTLRTPASFARSQGTSAKLLHLRSRRPR